MSISSHSGNLGSTFKLNIDVLVRGNSNAEVKKKLFQLLRANPEVLDIHIHTRAEHHDTKECKHSPTVQKTHTIANQAPPTASMRQDEPLHSISIEVEIGSYIKDQTLVRLEVNKTKGVRLSIPARILNYDPSNLLLNVYHVDEKMVYAFHLYEIENMTPYSQ
ncbi:hypothetical protein [Paenibacillus sp. 1001270B_150601_E10]|uniref:hypothetical protein n=1 Tax=Paenibacillus sp. 1001270B_150601_E10 TaxID=2787079 RepID=UPI0018A0F6EE|nr:hypothetical protein [Paenibacillus sp. 1001270B_150601_E10]